MNRADILNFARAAGVEAPGGPTWAYFTASLERFAALVEAEVRKEIEAAVLAERESCAELCDKGADRAIALQSGSPDALTNIMLRQVAVLGHAECANAIRARTLPAKDPQ